jgi:hypothetical protein
MKLPLEHFLRCGIYYEQLRSTHRALITKEHTLHTVGDILQYFSKEENRTLTERKIIETDMSKPYEEPLNLNQKFWTTGNNFFYYCIAYGFRDDIIEYKQANDYIKTVKNPVLYSKDYYSSKRELSDEEVQLFLDNTPIGGEGGTIIHGIHRTCAMIGRLIQGNPYIPFTVGVGHSGK